MDENINKAVETIAKIASSVADRHEALAVAIAREKTAKIQLVERVIEIAKPALRALSSRILKSCVTRWHDNAYTDDTKTYYEVRGLCLYDTDGGPTEACHRAHPRADSGGYEGWTLYLLSDGRLAEASYDGHWSKWQGATSELEVKLHIYESVTDCFVDGHDYIDNIVPPLAEALTQQAQGKMSERTKAAEERTAKLDAVVKLLK